MCWQPALGSRRRRVAGICAARGIGSRRWMPTCRTTRPTWYGSGMHLPGHDVRPGLASQAPGRLVEAHDSRWANGVRNAVLGQSIRDTGCSVRIFRRVPHCGCRCLTACTVLRAAFVARGMPLVAGTGACIGPGPWPVALQPLEPIAPGGRGLVGRCLALCTGPLQVAPMGAAEESRARGILVGLAAGRRWDQEG